MKHRRLSETIAVERATRSESAAGTVTETWTPLATVRAELLQRSMNEHLAAFGEAEEITTGFRIYTIPGVEIATGDRITHAGRALDIVDATEVQRDRVRMLEIICKQVTT